MSHVVLLGLLALAVSAAPVQAATATSYSGEATVVNVDVNTPITGTALLNVVLAHAGPLPATGGSDVDEILNANVSQAPMTASASVLRATTQGSGSTALSVARAAGLSLTLTNLVALTSTTLRSTATAVCGADGATVAGDSIIEGLVVNTTPVTVSGAPNQVIDVGPVHLVINEQIKNVAGNGSSGSITVNAVHLTIADPLNQNSFLTEVILSSAHADVTCPAQGPIDPAGAIGGPCADPAYYGIFDNTASSMAVLFRYRWTNGNGLQTFKKLVPAGAIYRMWEKWAKPGTSLKVGYKHPNTGNWVNLASDVAVKGYYPVCEYQRGFEYPAG